MLWDTNVICYDTVSSTVVTKLIADTVSLSLVCVVTITLTNVLLGINMTFGNKRLTNEM